MDAADLRSSSNDLSSAPNSDVEGPNSDRIAALANSNTITVSTSSPLATSVYPTSTTRSTTTPNVSNAATAPKTRKPRKKKDDAAEPPVEKEKKPRKPRAAPGTGPSSRKKVKTENTNGTPPVPNVPLASNPPLSQPHVSHAFAPASTSLLGHEAATAAAKPIQNGLTNEQPTVIPHNQVQPSSIPIVQPPPPPPPVSRSKPIFDPIRGVVVDRSAPTPPAPSTVSSTPPRTFHNPSTSPAISGIINQPEPLSQTTQLPQSIPTPPVNPPVDANSSIAHPKDENAMEVDLPPQADKKPDNVPAKPATKPRAKEQPPPLPAGSGLLSSSLFGGDSGLDAKSTGEKGPNIVLHIDLKDPNNKVVNFARLAEDKYGFAALYPRQAAQKERLAKVAAAGAALERAGSGTKGGTSASDSADEDGSVDIDRDSDNDGDAVMSGNNGKGDVGNSGTDGPAPRKRRKRKDEYDADDPFVDDSEMLWEAQAAASKDGFFVYIGPLVPEGEKATVERADGTVKRGRGRGRGGGPGSRGGRGGISSSNAETASSRGGGPGSRGGGVTRKPRVSKAERQQRELEKKQRESATILAAKPPSAVPS